MDIEFIKPHKKIGRPVGAKDSYQRVSPKRGPRIKKDTPKEVSTHPRMRPSYEEIGRHLVSLPNDIFQALLEIQKEASKDLGFPLSQGQAIAYVIRFYKRGHQ